MKRMIRKILGRFGYELRKAPQSPIDPLPVFDLAISYLTHVRGRSLSFVQVGANDGVFGDPLRKYILGAGWRGVLVEPQPDVFRRLQANYPGTSDRIFFENSAVSTQAGHVTMYRAKPTADLDVSDYQSSVASLSHRTAASQLGLDRRDLDQISVPAVRLDDLVRKYHLEGFDVLQVDTEGHEREVLLSLDLATERPSVIQFEHGHLSPSGIDAVASRLAEHGYLLYFGGRETDSVAVHSDALSGLQ